MDLKVILNSERRIGENRLIICLLQNFYANGMATRHANRLRMKIKEEARQWYSIFPKPSQLVTKIFSGRWAGKRALDL